jgi:hypothetical protein
MQKLFIKKDKKKKSIEKMDVSEILKQWVLWCPPKKREEMNKIVHVFLQGCFQISKERYIFEEQK